MQLFVYFICTLCAKCNYFTKMTLQKMPTTTRGALHFVLQNVLHFLHPYQN